MLVFLFQDCINPPSFSGVTWILGFGYVGFELGLSGYCIFLLSPLLGSHICILHNLVQKHIDPFLPLNIHIYTFESFDKYIEIFFVVVEEAGWVCVPLNSAITRVPDQKLPEWQTIKIDLGARILGQYLGRHILNSSALSNNRVVGWERFESSVSYILRLGIDWLPSFHL